MSVTQRFPFEGHGSAPLIVDAVYEGGTANNQGDDPINKLLSVGNAGGFRPLGSIVKRTVKYVVLYTSGVDPDWPDVLDPRTGGFVYHGDQKEPGRELHDTPRRGNLLLRHLFELAEGGPEQRAAVPPIFLFEKAVPGRSVAFRGLLAPGGPAIRPDERLVAVWKSRDGQRFQNYRATFTVLDEASVSRAWLDALRSGEDADAHAPAAWREWVASGAYRPLVAQPTRQTRAREDQLPKDPEGLRILAAVKSYFEASPTAFEACAARLWQMMAPAVSNVVVTRASVDGGRDAVGTYALGPLGDRVELSFSLEAKCYGLDNSVGVKEVARLISRLRHREFGVFVTTSYLARQAYSEIREDQHPVVVISGGDIVQLLRERGYRDVAAVERWLRQEFPGVR
ncbi:restriction endonuclease [Cellulomonas hominis]|uniref:Restriction endonuclease n=1 Tax=Cellulomonas hominis TaxID=156981 RepID=A0A7Z8K3P7_9CELL|nr:restriction endonuclease [Cellulomonas hominis]